MAVRLHGIPGGRAQAAPAPAPRPRFRSPLTVGRVIYFSALLVGAGFLLHWLIVTAIFVSATGVVERDVDRLAARERGRITRIAVQVGDRVREDQPLAWLDYAPGSSGAFVSEAAARAATQNAQVRDLRERRLDVDRQLAMLRSTIGGLHAQAKGLAAERRTLAHTRDTARRLVRSGAATEGEAEQLALKLAEVDKDLATAQRQASEQERAVETLRAQAADLDRALAQAGPLAPPVADPGVVRASRDGIVAWIGHHAGEVVGPGEVVLVLADERKIRVRAFVAPKDALAFAPRRAVTIRVPTGESLRGAVGQLHLLASVASEPQAPQLGHPQSPGLPLGSAPPPVDPNAAFLLADVTLVDPPPAIVAHLVAGAPCEVRVRRPFWGAR
ncbi:MAG TPA: HlyD family efflux transporter periplasmic adaptor subunit [Polyangia bacterium]|nr:HlyD family efflux transporter periplasmic adaptor subunit [Polyangia bacterium]